MTTTRTMITCDKYPLLARIEIETGVSGLKLIWVDSQRRWGIFKKKCYHKFWLNEQSWEDLRQTIDAQFNEKEKV